MEDQLFSSKQFATTFDSNVYLYKNLWSENTTMLINTTHSNEHDGEILEIADSINRVAVYVSTDNRLRYQKEALLSSERLLVFRPSYSKSDDSDSNSKCDYADLIINGIENIVAKYGHRIFIVDSVTRIAALSFGRNASAAYVMKRLVALQMRLGISLIIIARDATKSVVRSLGNLADGSIDLSNNSESDKSSAPHHATEQEFTLCLPDELILADDAPSSASDADSQPQTCRSNKSLSRRERRLLRRQAQSSRKS